MENSTEQNITFYTVQEVEAWRETDQMSEQAKLHLAAPMKVSMQTVSTFKAFEHAQFCFKPLAKTLKYFI